MSVASVGKPLGLPPSYIILGMPTLERSLSWTLVLLASQHFLPRFHGNYCPTFGGNTTLPQHNSSCGLGGALFPTAKVEHVA